MPTQGDHIIGKSEQANSHETYRRKAAEKRAAMDDPHKSTFHQPGESCHGKPGFPANNRSND